MAFVVDASVILAWLLPDERSADAQSVIERLALGHQAQAPALLPYEVGNALLQAQRRRRIPAALAVELEQAWARLPIALAPADHASAARAGELARRHDLSLYDAAYLELAQHRRFALATLDAPLRRAAQAESVPVLP
jgi:predicted nucleic acid-binding protein